MTMKMPQLMRMLFPQPAQVLERRLHKRALLYWQHARGEGDLVLVSDFDPLAIEDDLSHGFLLDLRKPADPTFSYVGPVLEQEVGVEGDRIHFASVPQQSLLMRFASHYPRVLASRHPETADYDFVTHAGYHVRCRGALLPLSTDGVSVDHVYGVISWKSEKVVS